MKQSYLVKQNFSLPDFLAPQLLNLKWNISRFSVRKLSYSFICKRWKQLIQLKCDLVFQAIALGRIYALRYELCDDMPRSPDLTDHNPERKMWNFLSPIALFVSKKVGWRKNELVPVAIQMDYTPGKLKLHTVRPYSCVVVFTNIFWQRIFDWLSKPINWFTFFLRSVDFRKIKPNTAAVSSFNVQEGKILSK